MLNRIKRPRVGLGVETLEAREVPAVCTWNYTGMGFGASANNANWVGNNAPGDDDDVYIPDGTGDMLLEHTRLRSIETEVGWVGAIKVDGGSACEIGGTATDYAYSYLGQTNIICYQDLTFDHGQVFLDDSDITRGNPFATAKTVTFADDTYVTGGLEFGTYIVNSGYLSLNSAVQITYSGSSFANSGTVEMYGTYTWTTFNSSPTNNIFTNTSDGTLKKTGTGTYTFGSYIHNEGVVSLYQGDLVLKGKATAGGAIGDVGIHSYGSLARIHLYGDTDLSSDYTIWVDGGSNNGISILDTKFGNDSYVASISGADVRFDSGVLNVGAHEGNGLGVLVVENDVYLYNNTLFKVDFDGFMGYADKLICDDVVLGVCSIEITTDGNPISQFTSFALIDATTRYGDFDSFFLPAKLTTAFSGQDYMVSYVP